MKILITGGGGFIGSNIAEYYAKKKKISHIHIIDNFSRYKLLNSKDCNIINYNYEYLRKFNNIDFFVENLNNFEYLNKLIKTNQYDIIFHTAGQTAVTNSLVNPYRDFKNNVISTINLLEAVRLSELNPKLILCSTNKIYGDNVNQIELDEIELRYQIKDKDFRGINEEYRIDLCKHTPYGVSKLSSDLYFQEYGSSYGLDTNICRLSCIYGPRQMVTEDQGWLGFMIASAIKKLKIKIFGDGKQVRDILYISDLINLFDLLIEKDVKNEVFCIGGGYDSTISILELINELQGILNYEISYEFKEWREGDQLFYISDIRKANKTLNWYPIVNIREGLEKTTSWIRKNLILFEYL
ncbi:MAG: GDP-mannose 4,6-dehydratase [Candidatus Lokiarchaeota archaeon]|nr:GDP-mannose 4,6-dehydratase [Candidatus Lokiarchaeota archaeon]